MDVLSTSDLGNDIAPDVADMVKQSYKDIGGFAGAEGEADIKKKYTHYYVSDVDEDPEPDVAILYRIQGNSVKASAVATDGTGKARQEIKTMLKQMFNRPNTWVEASGAVGNVMIKKLGLSTLDNEDSVKKLLPDHEITWHGAHPSGGVPYGNGWYSREIGGKPEIKIIVGNPPV